MAAVHRFEDLEAWCEARSLARAIYSVTSSGAFARDRGLCDQIRRAAVSVMSNIAEGFERNGKVEFRRFLIIAKGSAAEVMAQLYVALDAGLIDIDTFNTLSSQARSVSNLIGGLLRYLTTTTHS